MVKILHVIGSARIGGIEKLVLDLISVQIENPDLISEVLIGKRIGDFLEKFENLNTNCYFANISGGYDINIKKYFRVFKLYKKYDVIHFHGFNVLMILMSIFAKKKNVYTEHGNFGFGRKKKKSDTINNFLKKIILNKFIHFLSFNSDFTKSVAIRRFGLKNVKSKVIPNGISFSINSDHKIIENKILYKIGKRFVIGTSTRFAGFKRIDRLVKAFSGFKYKSESILLLVGDGPLRKDIENLVNELGLRNNVIFTGFKTNISDYQSIMDVCVFPSQNEPFGLVAVETLNLGKPTIAFTDGGGIKDIIKNISEEDVVENIKSLSERLNYYFQNRFEINKKRKERIEYSKSYDIKVMENTFFQIYQNLK